MASMLSRGVVLAENLVKNSSTTRVSYFIYVDEQEKTNFLIIYVHFTFVSKTL